MNTHQRPAAKKPSKPVEKEELVGGVKEEALDVLIREVRRTNELLIQIGHILKR